MRDDFIKPINPPPGSSTAIEEEILQPGLNKEISKTPRTMQSQQPPEIQPEIDHTNKNFKGQQKHEHIICFTRKHWIVLAPYFVGLILISSGLAVFFMSGFHKSLAVLMSPIAYRVVALGVIIILTYYFHRFFVRLFNYYLQTIIITNFRVVCLEMTLYFNNVRDSMDLHEIQDVVIHQEGVIKTLLNFGEVTITMSSSSNATKLLRYLPNPEYYFRKINKCKREYISARRQVKADETTK
ncbi:MAG: hypothetical protein WCT53_05815 [Candidatus Gracilibacteria bacterium]